MPSSSEFMRFSKSEKISRIAFLVCLIAPVGLVILIQSMIATASLRALSIMRAYASAESQWSKQQKNAIYYLHQYLDSNDRRDYEVFESAIAIPLGDMAGRRAMEALEPDLASAANGFQHGRVNEADIPGMIWLFMHFQGAPYLSEAIDAWRASDAPLSELSTLGESVHAQMAHGQTPDIIQTTDQISRIDRRLSPLADHFSELIGAGSRAVQFALTMINIAAAGILIAVFSWRTLRSLEDRRAYEDALNAEKEQAQSTLQSITDAIVRVDASGRVECFNPAAERLIGLNQGEALGRRLSSLICLIDKTSGEERIGLVDDILSETTPRHTESDGEIVLLSATNVTSISFSGRRIASGAQTMGAALVFRDLSQEQESIARLFWQANHDALTGLANRRSFERRLGAHIEALVSRGVESALLLIDLDQLKIVNDTCGHAAGDQLLREISTILEMNARDIDLVARLGGDEFALILENCGLAQAVQVAETVRGAIEDAMFVWRGHRFRTSASIGVVAVAGAASHVDEVLRSADIACYMAKEKGRNRVQAHEADDSELQQRVSEMSWAPKIAAAIEQNSLRLYAQEVRSLNSENAAVHFEVLLRLKDKDGRLVPPGAFVPAAERFGLMPQIDRWVVNSAFACLSDFVTSRNQHRVGTCAINLSGTGIGEPSFIEYVQGQFLAHGIPPSLICFEITETAAIANLEGATKFIKTFKDQGCRFALDDFGVGMSSFSYLKRLPVEYLKIDGSFVKDMLDDKVDRAVVETIARLAQTMGKKTVAEFVESLEMIDILRDFGVDYAQGYAVHKPEPIGEFLASSCGFSSGAEQQPAVTFDNCRISLDAVASAG